MKHFKFIACAAILLSIFQRVAAQKYAYEKAEVYLLKEDFSDAKDINAATYILHVTKYSDTLYTCRYYRKFGPMLKQESFLDANFSTPNGLFGWYDEKGNLDSDAVVYRGKKTSFGVYDDSLKTTLSMRYRDGSVYEKRDHLTDTYTDSAGNTRSLMEKEKEEREEFIQIKKAQADTNLIEASFPGGPKKWNKYLSSNLLIPDRLVKSMPEGVYHVTVSFVVDKEGNVKQVFLYHSVEWSADLEVFKIFENSPPWQPAVQFGRNVTYRQKQNIRLEVSRN